ncbi:bestrophin family ion channel [Geodermatophilus sp. DSM 44513]|uniref:bestrophin family protein n=1 Tax=Geodermatophilus sp. DSM 44513 TaxID=1528104 RepID=UPI0012858638|nr:bestrophin family ion channel [Geodermatophilus sp. DSM 44513]WNV75838.1 bestrophin family ion channel [Geodermatophilus sp. DSM 44513]
MWPDSRRRGVAGRGPGWGRWDVPADGHPPTTERALITSRVPRPSHAWRAIAVPFTVLLLWDVLVTVLYHAGARGFTGIDIQFTLFGTAIALFTGFMVNAAYQRWWEARTLWGQVVNSSRSLAREALVLLDERGEGARPGLGPQVVRAQVAYVHLLRTALRGQPVPDEARAHLDDAVREGVERSTNRPNAVLTHVGRLLAEAAHRGVLSDYRRVQMEATLVVLTDAQGGLERIKNTPLPVQYRFLPRFFAQVFGAILPFAVVNDLGWATPIGSGLVGLMFLLAVQIGDELAEPFADAVYDVPMTALTRTIEIDLVEMIGAEPPSALRPVDRVLW